MYIIDNGKPFSKEEIIKSIEESIDSIKKYGYEDKINQITLNELYDIRNKLPIKSDEISFYSLVDRYVEIVNSMWKVYLSQRKDGEVKYLVHNLAHREYHDAYRYKTISTSLITDNFIAFFSQFGSGIPNGFIVDPIKISCAYFLDNTIDNANENAYGSWFNFMLPFQVEYESIKNYGSGSDTLSYYQGRNDRGRYNNNCSEIGCSEFNISGYFYMSFGEGKLSPIYEKCKRMADSRNIPLVEIDYCELRKKKNLPQMNDIMKKDLLKNLLIKIGCYQELYMNNKDFFNRYYSLFADRYLELKASTEFSEDNILNLLKNCINEYKKQKEYEQSQVLRSSIASLREQIQNGDVVKK